MTARRKPWTDTGWLGIALILLGLAFLGLLWVGISTFDFDPDDFGAAYYLEEVPKRQWSTAIAVSLAVLAVLAALIAALKKPRRSMTSLLALLLLIPIGCVLYLSLWLGLDGINHAADLSQLLRK
ncbi:hypothetical protein [Psychromicrobium lacuslunae]|uniref:Uncharacterized protein n=1 Tax=Psychromicrobium lacuslunae TaxID=1618207 RepID=A0A0D4BZJ0_9MICC|nr:hypothetical protein [Psychromicrobium lacuslunae]AJT41550.1 hypothetical protein UM93_08565 [Psychromicrobium lacuslunae]